MSLSRRDVHVPADRRIIGWSLEAAGLIRDASALRSELAQRRTPEGMALLEALARAHTELQELRIRAMIYGARHGQPVHGMPPLP